MKKSFILSFLLLLLNLVACDSETSPPVPPDPPEQVIQPVTSPIQSDWKFVHGTGPGSLNENINCPFFDGDPLDLEEFQGKLYVAYSNAVIGRRIDVSVFDGDDDHPSWKSLGTLKEAAGYFSVAGIPDMTVYNDKLYVAWVQDSPYKARVFVYNGNDDQPEWTPVDGPNNMINFDPTKDASQPRLKVANGKLYVTWREAGLARVAVYNGLDDSPVWTSVSGQPVDGLIWNSSNSIGSNPNLYSNGTNLYVTWSEYDPTMPFSSPAQARVAQYNNDDASPHWNFIDGNGSEGINFNPSQMAVYSRLFSFQNNLYATWSEFPANLNTDDAGEIRLAQYSEADSWAFVDGNTDIGINWNPELFAGEPDTAAIGEVGFVAWGEGNDVYISYDTIRVAALSMDKQSKLSLSFVDGNQAVGLDPTGADYKNPKLATLGNKLYVAWMSSAGPTCSIHVASRLFQ